MKNIFEGAGTTVIHSQIDCRNGSGSGIKNININLDSNGIIEYLNKIEKELVKNRNYIDADCINKTINIIKKY